jgi:hypothetical protein
MLKNIAELPPRELWRHDQVGDLKGEDDRIEWVSLAELVKANSGKRGFTYTHYPVLDHVHGRHNRESIQAANALGFTINLSADNLQQADELANLGIGPVVTLLPTGQLTNTTTPAGRKVVVCPYDTHGVQCKTCQLCQRASRSVIVGFPAHGMRRRAASALAAGPPAHAGQADP